MRHLDLFSGIGGFALAAERVWPNVEHTFCEIDPFCQAVLRKHWPEAEIHGDIRTLTYPRQLHGQQLEGEGVQRSDEACGKARAGYKSQIDLLTGGFPCQPFSSAGRRRGTEDDRHLWPEMLRVIRETSPRWVIGENVRGFLTWNGGLVLDEAFADLEGLGYEVGAFVIPAVAVNAPHRRDRVWIVGHSRSDESRGLPSVERKKVPETRKPSEIRDASNPKSLHVGCGRKEAAGHDREPDREGGVEGRSQWNEDWSSAAARPCSLDDGLPGGLVRPRGWRNAALKAAGNAIVPQVAEQIMRAIKATDTI